MFSRKHAQQNLCKTRSSPAGAVRKSKHSIRKSERRNALDSSPRRGQTGSVSHESESDAASRREQRRFVLKFLALAGALLVIYCFPYKENGVSERGFDVFLAGYARLARVAIALFDPSASVFGNEIHGRFAVRIIKGCDAMEAKILFVSAVLAFPGTWPRKLLVAATGLVALTLVNVLRIASLYVAGVLRPSLVEPLHFETWPFIMVAVASLLFLGGTTLMRASEPARDRE